MFKIKSYVEYIMPLECLIQSVWFCQYDATLVPSLPAVESSHLVKLYILENSSHKSASREMTNGSTQHSQRQ